MSPDTAKKLLRILVGCAIILALCVVMLGAFTRLTNAGLGCPDWPGCYGRMVLPSTSLERAYSQSQYPQAPLEVAKAWTEMTHRYLAFSLVLLIGLIGLNVNRLRQRGVKIPGTIPFTLILLLVFQAALGMWTVTLKLWPVVVMAHLLGGISIFACLCYFRLQLAEPLLEETSLKKAHWHLWVGLGMSIVFIQIALGGWVSSNYAGLACVGFPRCNGLWWPSFHFGTGLDLFAPPSNLNYQGGILESNVRMSIQFVHRLGALVTAIYVTTLSILLLRQLPKRRVRINVAIILVLLFTQITLGILNVIWMLPLDIAVAHNGVAALLFASMTSLFFLTRGE